MTKNAEQILEIVRTSTEHLSAEQIFLRLKETNKGVAMATVYNNLSYLYKEGFIGMTTSCVCVVGSCRIFSWRI